MLSYFVFSNFGSALKLLISREEYEKNTGETKEVPVKIYNGRSLSGKAHTDQWAGA